MRYVAFLHGVNTVDGNSTDMADIKKHFEFLGFKNVSTYVQSGNVIFETEGSDSDSLRWMIEPYLERALGFKVPVILRTTDDIRDIIDNNPFASLKQNDTDKWYVTLLSDVPERAANGTLGVYSNDAEYARVVKSEVYIFARNYTRTHFSNSYLERKLGLAATTRNWDTVYKLAML